MLNELEIRKKIYEVDQLYPKVKNLNNRIELIGIKLGLLTALGAANEVAWNDRLNHLEGKP